MKFLPIALGTFSLLSLSVNIPATVATQQLFCQGRMNNGWSYSAEFLNGRFERIRWTRSGQPPQVSSLSFKNTNNKGQPIYRGSLFAAVSVTLIIERRCPSRFANFRGSGRMGLVAGKLRSF